MLNQDRPSEIGVIGYGRLGGALVEALSLANGDSILVSSTREGIPALNGIHVSKATLVSRSRWVFLAVPDGKIEQVAAGLAVGPEHTIVHCSGSTPLSALQSVADRGAQVAGFHPLQAFPAGSDATRFQGITIGIEAEAPTFAQLSRLATAMGAVVMPLKGVDRALYHAGAVLVSNHAVALMKAASDTWSHAGLDGSAAHQALMPLLQGAVSAIVDKGMSDGLTGPLLRGDVDTVSGHLKMLRARDPLLATTYSALSQLLLRLGTEVGRDRRQELRQLLERDLNSE